MIKFIILGIIQGITEFLPVSSSAHLIIMQRILRVPGEEIAISLVMHLGTCLALIIFFFKDILNALRNIKFLSLIIIVTIITGIIGVSGKDYFESLFSSLKAISMALGFTAIVLILTKRCTDTKRNILNIKDALILGLMQGLAIIPGISRSGITISTLLFRGIDRETCFKFSFLASIPAILGAAIIEAKEISFAFRGDFKNLSLGFIFSLLVGLLSLKVLKIILSKSKLYYFGYYCIAVSIITFLFK